MKMGPVPKSEEVDTGPTGAIFARAVSRARAEGQSQAQAQTTQLIVADHT